MGDFPVVSQVTIMESNNHWKLYYSALSLYLRETETWKQVDGSKKGDFDSNSLATSIHYKQNLSKLFTNKGVDLITASGQ